MGDMLAYDETLALSPVHCKHLKHFIPLRQVIDSDVYNLHLFGKCQLLAFNLY